MPDKPAATKYTVCFGIRFISTIINGNILEPLDPEEMITAANNDEAKEVAERKRQVLEAIETTKPAPPGFTKEVIIINILNQVNKQRLDNYL